MAESLQHAGGSAFPCLQDCSMDVVGESGLRQAVLGSSASCTLPAKPESRKFQVLLTGKIDSEEKLWLFYES